MPGIARSSVLIAGLALWPGVIPFVVAADAHGQFAVRGAGLMTCEIYSHERAAQSPAYLVAAAWVDGYITATNQHMADTYDVMPFESTELLAAVIGRHCEQHPEDRVFPVIDNLIEKLYQDRLQAHSEKIEIAVEQRHLSMYVELVKRMQSRLAAADLYQGAVTGHFDAPTRKALMAYQQSIGFEPTGFPDQATLWRLMRSETSQAAAGSRK